MLKRQKRTVLYPVVTSVRRFPEKQAARHSRRGRPLNSPSSFVHVARIFWVTFMGLTSFKAHDSFKSIEFPPYLFGFSIDSSSIAPLPNTWKQSLHIHVRTHGRRKTCGGCKVLHELAASIADLNISTTDADRCPTESELAGSLAAKRTIAIIYPELDPELDKPSYPCTGNGTRIHVHWILAPLGNFVPLDHYRTWGRDDLVFHFASSTAVHPALLPPSNILQVITGPREGDESDVSVEELNNPGRRGTLWLVRKAHLFHSEIHHIHKSLPEPHVKMNASLPLKQFLQFEYFVSYDPYCFYSYTAAMMGAISIVYPVTNMSRQEWVEGTYVGEYVKENRGNVPGIAYGGTNAEIEYANRTKRELRQFMMDVRRWGKQVTVERFARDCYRAGRGETKLPSALLAQDAYYRWYDEDGNLNLTSASLEAEKIQMEGVRAQH